MFFDQYFFPTGVVHATLPVECISPKPLVRYLGRLRASVLSDVHLLNGVDPAKPESDHTDLTVVLPQALQPILESESDFLMWFDPISKPIKEDHGLPHYMFPVGKLMGMDLLYLPDVSIAVIPEKWNMVAVEFDVHRRRSKTPQEGE